MLGGITEQIKRIKYYWDKFLKLSKIYLLIFSSRLDQNMSFYSLAEHIVFKSKYLFFCYYDFHNSPLMLTFFFNSHITGRILLLLQYKHCTAERFKINQATTYFKHTKAKTVQKKFGPSFHSILDHSEVFLHFFIH